MSSVAQVTIYFLYYIYHEKKLYIFELKIVLCKHKHRCISDSERSLVKNKDKYTFLSGKSMAGSSVFGYVPCKMTVFRGKFDAHLVFAQLYIPPPTRSVVYQITTEDLITFQGIH